MRDNTDDSEGSFFSRWSRRKADERAGKPLAQPQAPAKPLQDQGSPEPAQPLSPFADQAAQASPAETPETVKLPTLEDTQKLTPHS